MRRRTWVGRQVGGWVGRWVGGRGEREGRLTAAGAFPHGAGFETVVDNVLEILAHADLTHETVLVSIHA